MLSRDAENASFRYRRGLLEGSLEPLADYLAAGHPMDHVLRRELVEAIEGRTGDGLYTLKLCKNRSGAGTAISHRRTLRRNGEIVAYFRQLPHERGQWAAAVLDTMSHFGVTRTTVTDALQKAGVGDKSDKTPK